MEGFTGISLPITFGKQSIYDFKLVSTIIWECTAYFFWTPKFPKARHVQNASQS